MSALHRCKRALDRALEFAVGLVMGALVLDVVWQVLTRYALGDPSAWTEEAATFLMIWAGLLGGAVALQRNAHIGVDVVVARLSPSWRRRVHTLGWLIVATFAATAMGYGGGVLVARTLELGQRSPSLGLEMGYVYLALPVSGTMIALSALERVLSPEPPA